MSAITVLLGFVNTPSAGANGLEVGTLGAGSIFPLESKVIQLVSESVTIDLSNEPGQVQCRYELKNLSDSAQTIRMAFITALPSEGYTWPPRSYEAAGIIVGAGGEDVSIEMAPLDLDRWTSILDAPPDSLPTWEVTFDAGASRNLWIMYQVGWNGDAPGYHRGRDFTYYARPAALWAGIVQKATITIDVGEPLTQLLQCQDSSHACVGFHASPLGYEWIASGVRWTYVDWEPDVDFEVWMNWTSSPPPGNK